MTDRESRLSSNSPRPTPLELSTFLPYACLQLQTPFRVTVLTQVRKQYVGVKDKSKKVQREKSTMRSVVRSSIPRTSRDQDKTESVMAYWPDDDPRDLVRLTAVADAAGRCLELILQRTKVPKLLLKIIGFCIPYHPYLNKITIRWGKMDGYTISEISKQLRQSQYITELCLDDTPVSHHNQYILLEYRTQLKCLSLERCRLDDADCIAIASRLAYPLPASATLCNLSLASNFISDEGAVALGTMLRSNRRLRYLNLSGNRITNAGAPYIFSSLMQFPMTYDEILSQRLRNLKYIKLRKEVYNKCLSQLRDIPVTKSLDDRGSGKKKPHARSKRQSTTALTVASEPLSSENIAAKADDMTRDIIGAYDDPFNVKDTVRKNAYVFSIGNFTLSYLNLAHNCLGHESLVKLLEVMKYQAEKTSKPQAGIIRVVVEGNPLPVSSKELEGLQGLCDLACGSHTATSHKSDKFKSLKLSKK